MRPRTEEPRGVTAVLGPLAIGLALVALLVLPASAGAVLAGTNGRIVFIEGPAFGNTQLFLRSVTSSTGAGLTTGPLATGLAEQHRHPTWSPDRTKVAFAEGPGGAIGYDIYILDLTTPGATAQNITNSSGVTDDRPAWSPDGTRIAYESGNDIIVHPLNGGGDLNLTSTLTPKAWKAAWSPDSQTLYYSVGDISQPPNGNTNDIRLYQQPANNASAGTELFHISGAHVFQPSISPDGTKLCYTTSTAAGNSTSAAVVAAPLSAPGSFTVIADSGKGDYNCTWSPDGTKIAYTEDYAGNGEIFMSNSDGRGIPIDLTNAAGVFEGSPDWAPDGRPTCPDAAATTTVTKPVTVTVACSDTGPAYEQSKVREFTKTNPRHGAVKQEPAGDRFTYTPNAALRRHGLLQGRQLRRLRLWGRHRHRHDHRTGTEVRRTPGNHRRHSRQRRTRRNARQRRDRRARRQRPDPRRPRQRRDLRRSRTRPGKWRSRCRQDRGRPRERQAVWRRRRRPTVRRQRERLSQRWPRPRQR